MMLFLGCRVSKSAEEGLNAGTGFVSFSILEFYLSSFGEYFISNLFLCDSVATLQAEAALVRMESWKRRLGKANL